MNFFRNKQKIVWILLIIILSSIFIHTAFAEENCTDDVNQSSCEDLLKVEVNDTSKKISIDYSNENVKDSQETTLFIISDNPGVNILDKASFELFEENKLKNVNLIVRSGDQVKAMDEGELTYYLSACDAFVGEWISSDVDSVLTSVLTKNPSLSNKKMFLILEPPSGNLNSDSSSINLIRNNTLNYEKIFKTFSNEDLINYFKNTKRGITYSNVYNYSVLEN